MVSGRALKKTEREGHAELMRNPKDWLVLSLLPPPSLAGLLLFQPSGPFPVCTLFWSLDFCELKDWSLNSGFQKCIFYSPKNLLIDDKL